MSMPPRRTHLDAVCGSGLTWVYSRRLSPGDTEALPCPGPQHRGDKTTRKGASTNPSAQNRPGSRFAEPRGVAQVVRQFGSRSDKRLCIFIKINLPQLRRPDGPAIGATLREFKEKNTEVKEFFDGKAKK